MNMKKFFVILYFFWAIHLSAFAQQKILVSQISGFTQAVVSVISTTTNLSPATTAGMVTNFGRLGGLTFTNIGSRTWTAPGFLRWDDNEHGLVVDTDTTDSSITLGEEINVRVHNTCGTNILNGQIVKLCQGAGPFVNVTLADNSTLAGSIVFGVATTDIANNGFGRVTAFGKVRGLVTTGYVEGAIVYLGRNGAITNAAPLYPAYEVVIGVVEYTHGTEGRIFVKPYRNGWARSGDIPAQTNIAHNSLLGIEGAGSLHVSADQTNLIATAWQNPASATNWTWTKTATAVTVTGYTGPTNVVVPDMLDGLPVTGFGTIFANTAITSISGGANVTTLVDNTFTDCLTLTSVDLPSITTIGEYSFSYCPDLIYINLPNVVTIGNLAFQSAASLSSVSLPSVITIGEYAFAACPVLTSIDLPSAMILGDYAFAYCPELIYINLPNVVTIGNLAFQSSTTLSSVSLPSIMTVGAYAFAECHKLTSVDLPNVKVIKTRTFEDCPALTSVYFGQNAPAEKADVYFNTPNVTNYVTNPNATGWSTNWNGRPVVRLPLAGNLTGNVTGNATTATSLSAGSDSNRLANALTNTPTLQQVVTAGGTVTTGIVTIDAENARTNTYGGYLGIGPERWQANYGEASGIGSWANNYGTASGNGSWANNYGTASGEGSWANYGGTASGEGSWANYGGTASGKASWANYGGTASGNASWANYGGTASGIGAWANNGGTASGAGSWAMGPTAVASNANSFAWNDQYSHGDGSFNIGAPSLLWLGGISLQTLLDGKLPTNATAASIGAVPTNLTITIDGTPKTYPDLNFTTAAGEGVTFPQATNIAVEVMSLAPIRITDARFFLGGLSNTPQSVRARLAVSQKPNNRCTDLVYLATNMLFYSVTSTVAGSADTYTNVVVDASGFIANDMYTKPDASQATWQTCSNAADTVVSWNCSNMVATAAGTTISRVNRFRVPDYYDATGGSNINITINFTTPYTNTVSYNIAYWSRTNFTTAVGSVVVTNSATLSIPYVR
jgi:hypothetical protein